MPLEIKSRPGFKINARELKQIYVCFLKFSKIKKDPSVSLAFVDQKEIKQLNKIYRQKNRPTDVLSFGSRESQAIPGESDLGEILICYFVAVSQAKASGHSTAAEIKILLIHGLLHLMGFDHKNIKEQKRMKNAEQKICSMLN